MLKSFCPLATVSFFAFSRHSVDHPRLPVETKDSPVNGTSAVSRLMSDL
jgi:hypothetical protein